jgi:hypothetical protein
MGVGATKLSGRLQKKHIVPKNENERKNSMKENIRG